MRIVYENNINQVMYEISARPSFYYKTPMFTSAQGERKLDILLEEYQNKEAIFENDTTKNTKAES